MVPDYLRTKPDPDVEQREHQLILRANQIIPDAGQVMYVGHNTRCLYVIVIICRSSFQKQINSLNKVVNQTLELISSLRDQWESEAGNHTLSETRNEYRFVKQAISSFQRFKRWHYTDVVSGRHASTHQRCLLRKRIKDSDEDVNWPIADSYAGSVDSSKPTVIR